MSWTKEDKPTTMSWSNITKPTLEASYLLKEDSYYLLLENGDKIIIIDASGSWANNTKPSSTWANNTKPS